MTGTNPSPTGGRAQIARLQERILIELRARHDRRRERRRTRTKPPPRPPAPPAA